MSAVVPFTNTGRALKCWAPSQLGGGRNVAGDIEIHWIRRARINGAWIGGADVPLGEEIEKYRLDFYTDITYATIGGTRYSLTPTYTFTAADQFAVFSAVLSAGNCFTAVSQLGALGYGYETRKAL